MWLHVLDEISKDLINTLKIAENYAYLAFKQTRIYSCLFD